MSSPRSSSSSQNQKSSSLPVRFAKSAFFQIFVFFTTVIVLGVAYASWTTLNVSQGADGQPVTQTLMQGIINNLNDLQARVTAVESQTTGGTVTGPLRWSSEYSGQAHTTAWNTCLALAPVGSWRLPIEDEIEYGRRSNGTLFTGAKNYWSSSPSGSYGPMQYFLAWNPVDSYWFSCVATNTSGCNGNVNPLVFRCVSNAN